MNAKECKGYLMQLIDPASWFAHTIGVAIAAVWSFVLPVASFLYLIGAMVLVDLYTGWRKNKKLIGASLNSHGVGKTLEKTLMYLVLMLVSRGIDKVYGLDGTLSLAWFVAGLIIGRELLSIFENVDVVLGTNFSDRIKDAWKRITGNT